MTSIATRRHLGAALAGLVRVWLPARAPDPAGPGRRGPATAPRSASTCARQSRPAPAALTARSAAAGRVGAVIGNSHAFKKGRLTRKVSEK
jgi:hypothetical protein